MSETTMRKCPSCGSLKVEPSGHVTASVGLLRSDYHCLGCEETFVYRREQAT
jgi:transposase-like protein